MTKIALLLLLLLCSSCSSNRLQLKNFEKLPNYRQRQIPVSSRDEAKKVIGNKVNFLKMLFEQSVDPYFGTPKWSPVCLEMNQIGDIREESGGIQSISSLVLNAEGEPGFCPPGNISSYVIFLFCDGMKDVIEMKFNKTEAYKVPSNLCD